MQWLTNWMMKEGPGVRKDEPKKTGLALFVSIILREPWELFKLNLLMLLLCIPVITIPANLVAAGRICGLMIEDEVVFFWRDYWRAFGQRAVASTLWGLFFAVLLGICGYSAFIYGQLGLHDMVYVAPAVIAICLTLLVLMVAVCLFTILSKQVCLPALVLLKSACLAALAKPIPILAGIAFAALLWLAHVIFYPASIFLPVVLNFSLGTLAMVFGAYKATDFALQMLELVGSRQGAEESASI
ncbi:DUF624 domain-containing protein [uncultured Cohaesibacter sp.]|uniref:DUF624 domain-containing protein n=1 Tax=uncultured Cohaesibacter sp. TaxID=1002546 RepID=UPI00292F0C76|nr:DUF624 domain-containing protein [uncultured Cohaesibacter sp.]